MPTSPMGKDNKYYQVDVSCTSSKTQGLWDYNAWRLNLDYIESNSKCNLTFTSNMSKEQYDEYIKSGVALRRSTYRGKDITDYFKGTKKFNDKDLYKQISDGTFDDIYVGDYIVSEHQDSEVKNIIWLIADLDNYWNQGDEALKQHHATIIPSSQLTLASMNSENTSEGGYAGSEMFKSILGTIEEKDGVKTATGVLGDYIYPDFGDHIIKYKTPLADKIDTDRTNNYGLNNGASSGWHWFPRYLDLMSEVNVYGTTVWSSSGYDIGIDNRQYAIFQLRPELINQTLNSNRFSYWLKAVVSSKSFARVISYGSADEVWEGASASLGVRPRFLIN